MEFAVVPGSPEFTQPGGHRLGKMINESVVKAEPEGYPTGASQGDIVARQIDTLETVDFFEMA